MSTTTSIILAQLLRDVVEHRVRPLVIPAEFCEFRVQVDAGEDDEEHDEDVDAICHTADRLPRRQYGGACVHAQLHPDRLLRRGGSSSRIVLLQCLAVCTCSVAHADDAGIDDCHQHLTVALDRVKIGSELGCLVGTAGRIPQAP